MINIGILEDVSDEDDPRYDKIILASASPRRKELLKQMGLEFEVMPSHCEEVITRKIPWEIVMELSSQKARELVYKAAMDSAI